MGREGRDYWVAQLSEYWDSGLTIQEYSELKELPYESTRRWIRVLEKARQDDVSDPESSKESIGEIHRRSFHCRRNLDGRQIDVVDLAKKRSAEL